MKSIRFGSLFILLFFCANIYAQRSVNVSGEYRYVVPENISTEQAKQIAVERARLKAMASAFNTTVSQIAMSSVKIKDGETSTSFNSYGGTEVKGIWIADSKEPEFEILHEGDIYVITARVVGKAREIQRSEVELKMDILCNGVRSLSFENGDCLSVKFKAAANGHLAIYLIDENNENAYCLMPYENGDGSSREIKNNKEYIFLSNNDPLYPSYMENTILTTRKEKEQNRLVMIYSINEFSLPLGNMGEYVMELPYNKFSSWLHKSRIKDEHMQVVDNIIVEIIK